MKKELKVDTAASATFSHRKTKTPAHQTLVVLFLDNRLRSLVMTVIMKILVRLMHEVTADEIDIENVSESP